MNAGAQSLKPLARAANLPRAEHISLEAETDNPSLTATTMRRKVLATYELTSRLRGHATRLCLLEGHFLSVRSSRPRSGVLNYSFDLRFATAKPVRIRHMAWPWLAMTCAIFAGSCLVLWRAFEQVGPLLTAAAFYRGIGGLLITLAALLLFLRGTTESLVFTSVHGGVPFISVTGGLGSARAGKSFFIALIKAINAAKLARPQLAPQFLRDEMREHHRLRELGVLSQADYAASKERILRSHE